MVVMASRGSLTRATHVVCCILAFAAFIWPASGFCQVIDTTSTEPLESVLETVDAEEADGEQLVELLASLLENPLDVNTADRVDLAQIPVLGPGLAQAIVSYRSTNGRFASLPELLQVDGISEDIYAEARAFLTIGELETPDRRPSRFVRPPTLAAVLDGLRLEAIQRVTRRLDLGVGYSGDSTRTTYVGGPSRVYTRLRATYGRQVSINLTAEKDPGEKITWGPDTGTYGYDHVTGHVALRDFGRLKSFVAGDFTAAFGQGLVLWRGLSGGKGREVISPAVRTGSGVRAYGSTEENQFFRGSAVTIAVSPGISISAMASRRSLDATVATEADDDGFALTEIVTALGATGLHRTDSELARRDELVERFAAAAAEWRSSNHVLGVVGYRSSFDKPVVAGDQLYERFRFAGDEARVGSVFSSVFVGDYVVFGEAATDQDGEMALTGGVSAAIGRTVRAVVAARSFDRGFTNLHSFGFGEASGSTQNERGVYLGVQIRPNTRWRIAGFVDQYRFPWARFGVARPSVGVESLAMVEHRPRRWVLWYIQARSETKEAGYRILSPSGAELDAVRNETRQSLRGHFQYDFSRRMTTRTRVEGTRFEAGGNASYGMLLFQDVQVLVMPTLRIDTRAMLFDTDGFDTRVFTYEYDLRYTFSVPAFSGAGQRMYVMLTYAPTPAVSIQLKYAATRFEYVESVGSGLDETAGNRLREIRAQVIWKM